MQSFPIPNPITNPNTTDTNAPSEFELVNCPREGDGSVNLEQNVEGCDSHVFDE